jgi:hypothetical protein
MWVWAPSAVARALPPSFPAQQLGDKTADAANARGRYLGCVVESALVLVLEI